MRSCESALSSSQCPFLGPGWLVNVYPRKAFRCGGVTTYKVYIAPDGSRYKSLVRAKAVADGPYCVACGSGEETPGNEILLCDTKDCDQAWHLACLPEPLFSVPAGDWFCPRCIDWVSDCPSHEYGHDGAPLEAQQTSSSDPTLRAQLIGGHRARLKDLRSDEAASHPSPPREGMSPCKSCTSPSKSRRTLVADARPACIAPGCMGTIDACLDQERMLACTLCGKQWQSCWWYNFLTRSEGGRQQALIQMVATGAGRLDCPGTSGQDTSTAPEASHANESDASRQGKRQASSHWSSSPQKLKAQRRMRSSIIYDDMDGTSSELDKRAAAQGQSMCDEQTNSLSSPKVCKVQRRTRSAVSQEVDAASAATYDQAPQDDQRDFELKFSGDADRYRSHTECGKCVNCLDKVSARSAERACLHVRMQRSRPRPDWDAL